ncbi:hypothetical protein [Actinoplanes sp. NPDC020271]|uniref:hypothetical protein n=1 Tax=Actinoplanes sp. NPDC020271 TaxID=3363896 RepID=UPI0037A924E2
MHTSLSTCAFVAAAGAATLLLTSAPAAAAGSGSTIQVDVASDGTPANAAAFFADISADGRYVAFASNASNLVPGDVNNVTDVFVRDTVGGTTTLVSGAPNGQPGLGAADTQVAISGNGRYVAFSSLAPNLVTGDTNNRLDVFVRDRQTGVTTRVSVFAGDRQIPATSVTPTISDNGRYVTFVTGPPAGTDDEGLPINSSTAFVHDRQTGRTTRASRQANGGTNLEVLNAAISGNGKRVVFRGLGDWIGDGATNSGIFVHDLASRVTVRADVPAGGGAAIPSISRDGTRVGLVTGDPYVPADTNGTVDVYVRDLITDTTTLVSFNQSGTGAGNDISSESEISGDGRHVVFTSIATDLVAGDVNGPARDVFLRDLNTGRTTAISVTPAGTTSNGDSSGTVASANGSRVVFRSTATDLGVGPGGGGQHLYRRCLRNC